jgi:hypothetical protein
MDLKKMEWEPVKWVNLAQDRERLRGDVKTTLLHGASGLVTSFLVIWRSVSECVARITASPLDVDVWEPA